MPDLVNLPDLDHAARDVPGEDSEDDDRDTNIMIMPSLVGVPVPVLGVCSGADLHTVQYSTVQYSIVQCVLVLTSSSLPSSSTRYQYTAGTGHPPTSTPPTYLTII